MRPRRSVDYKAAQAPGTPNWLKTSSRQSEGPSQGVNKENDRPALATRKGRGSKSLPGLREEGSDKSGAEEKAKAERSDSQRGGSKSNEGASSKSAKGAAKAEASQDVQEPDPAPEVAAKSHKGAPKTKLRKSAPSTQQEHAAVSSKANPRQTKSLGKRALPEHERQEAPVLKKKAKASEPKGGAAHAADRKEKAAKSGKPVGKGSGGTDSWNTGEDTHAATEAAPEPATAKSSRHRSAAQQEEPVNKKGDEYFLCMHLSNIITSHRLLNRQESCRKPKKEMNFKTP